MEEFDGLWQRWLEHWQDLCDPGGEPWQDQYCAGGMINDLWNDRDRLAACLAPLPAAEALTARINQIMDAVIGGAAHDPGLYFLVANPYRATDDELMAWTMSFYERCHDLTGQPASMPLVRVVRCGKPHEAFLATWQRGDNDPHDALDDWVADALDRCCSLDERAAYYFLGEPLYKIACNFMLRGFVRWALLQGKLPGPDPYRPQFDLWRSGACELYRPDQPVTIFAPDL
jgi:hypothetical protein